MDAFASGSWSYGLAWARYDAEGRMVGGEQGISIYSHFRARTQKTTKTRHKSEKQDVVPLFSLLGGSKVLNWGVLFSGSRPFHQYFPVK